MPGPTKWLEEGLFPRVVLDGERIELAYQPVTLDQGPGPVLATFRVECVVRHHTGSVVYTADDLTMPPGAFAEFAADLKQVLDGGALGATLMPVGRELVLSLARAGGDVQMSVAVSEWEGPYDPPTVLSAGCAKLNTDRTYRWVRELGEYGRRLEEWVLANRDP
jgi:hypothetical protein